MSYTDAERHQMAARYECPDPDNHLQSYVWEGNGYGLLIQGFDTDDHLTGRCSCGQRFPISEDVMEIARRWNEHLTREH